MWVMVMVARKPCGLDPTSLVAGYFDQKFGKIGEGSGLRGRSILGCSKDPGLCKFGHNQIYAGPEG